MTASAVYCQCPGCGRDALASAVQGAHRCSACNFDYTTLATDTALRERWMLDNLRRGPMFQLAVIHLYRHILGVTLEQADSAVTAFASRSGVRLSNDKLIPTFAIVAALALVLVIVVVLVVALRHRH